MAEEAEKEKENEEAKKGRRTEIPKVETEGKRERRTAIPETKPATPNYKVVEKK